MRTILEELQIEINRTKDKIKETEKRTIELQGQLLAYEASYKIALETIQEIEEQN